MSPGFVPRVGFGAHVCYHCRISPPRFLAECRKRRLNQGSFVLLFFRLFALSDLCLVFACLFSCTALFVSISQVIGCEDRRRNDLYCVGWGVKLCSTDLLNRLRLSATAGLSCLYSLLQSSFSHHCGTVHNQ